MAIRFPTPDEVIHNFREHPTVFLAGIVLGIAVGLFLGYHFASSGIKSTLARANLVEEQRETYKAQLRDTKEQKNTISLLLDKKDNQIKSIKKQYEERMAGKNAELASTKKAAEGLEDQLKMARKELLVKKTQLHDTEDKYNRISLLLDTKDKQIISVTKQYEEILASKNANLESAQKTAKSLDDQLSKAQNELLVQERQLAELEKAIKTEKSRTINRDKNHSKIQTELNGRIAELSEENSSQKKQDIHNSEKLAEISNEAINILVYLFKSDKRRTEKEISRALNMTRGNTDYHLDLIRRYDFLYSSGWYSGGGESYSYLGLTKKGREFIVKRGLADEKTSGRPLEVWEH